MATSGKSMVDGLKNNLEKKQWSLKTVTAIVLFSAIIMVFVFFGYSSGNDAGGQGSAARVNNTYISLVDLNNETQRLEQFYSSLFGGQIPAGAQRQFIQNQALDNLISSELMAQGAVKEKVLSADAEVAYFITNEVDAFKEEGRFRRDRYENVLLANQWSPGVFESRIRKDRQVQRLRRLFEVGLDPMVLEESKLTELSQTQLNLEWVKLDKEAFEKTNAVTEGQVKEKIANAEFKKKIEDEFQNRKSSLDKAEEVRASHILIKGTDAAALEKIKDLRKKAEVGDFAALAKQFSEDEGSKAQGGDLGFFGRGRMVPEFEASAFIQSVGSLSEPVKSQFGYHLIKVTERKAAQEAILADHETEIAKSLMAAELFEDKMKAIEAGLQKGEASTVEAALKEFKTNWEETGWFELGATAVPKIPVPAVVEALPDLIQKKGIHSKVLREGPTSYLVKFKAIKTDDKADSSKQLAAETSRAQGRTTELLGEWIENAKKSAVVEKKSQVANQ